MNYNPKDLNKAIKRHFRHEEESDLEIMSITQLKEIIHYFEQGGDIRESGHGYRSIMDNAVDVNKIRKELENSQEVRMYGNNGGKDLTLDSIGLAHATATYLQDKGLKVIVVEKGNKLNLIVSKQKELEGAVQNA